MLKLWENPILSAEDRLEAASGEIDRLMALLEKAAHPVANLRTEPVASDRGVRILCDGVLRMDAALISRDTNAASKQ